MSPLIRKTRAIMVMSVLFGIMDIGNGCRSNQGDGVDLRLNCCQQQQNQDSLGFPKAGSDKMDVAPRSPLAARLFQSEAQPQPAGLEPDSTQPRHAPPARLPAAAPEHRLDPEPPVGQGEQNIQQGQQRDIELEHRYAEHLSDAEGNELFAGPLKNSEDKLQEHVTKLMRNWIAKKQSLLEEFLNLWYDPYSNSSKVVRDVKQSMSEFKKEWSKEFFDKMSNAENDGIADPVLVAAWSQLMNRIKDWEDKLHGHITKLEKPSVPHNPQWEDDRVGDSSSPESDSVFFLLREDSAQEEQHRVDDISSEHWDSEYWNGPSSDSVLMLEDREDESSSAAKLEERVEGQYVEELDDKKPAAYNPEFVGIEYLD